MKKPIIGLNMDFSEVDDKPRMTARKEYVDAVIEAGGVPHLVPCVTDSDVLEYHVQNVDAFVFVGGKDYHPKHFDEPLHEKIKLINESREAVDLLLIEKTLGAGMPVLGICAGIQLLCIGRGGKIVQHVVTAVDHVKGQTHAIEISGGSMVSGLFGEASITVNSYHHQAVNPDVPGDGMTVTALAPDGVVEAIESDDDRFLLGVQWHPERMDVEHRHKIFSALIVAARG